MRRFLDVGIHGGTSPIVSNVVDTSLFRKASGAAAGEALDTHGMSSLIGPAGGFFFTGMQAMHGYREDGLSGAFSYTLKSIAENAAAEKFGYARKLSGVAVGNAEAGGLMFKHSVMMRGGMAGFLGVNVAANLGGTIGYGVAGLPGAVAGSFIGAAATTATGMGAVTAGAVLLAAPAAAYAGWKLAQKGGEMGRQYQSARRGTNTDGSMAAFMTQNATTSRARAMQAIHKSHLNGRAALGNEATFMHTNKNYFGSYR
jgi:hypothetical protein